VQDMIRTTGQ